MPDNRDYKKPSYGKYFKEAFARDAMVFHVFGAMAQFERNLIVERTKAGLEVTKQRGRRRGRSVPLSPEQKDLVQSMIAQDKLILSTNR